MKKSDATTEQLDFWRGDFGNAYCGRNQATPLHLQALVALWGDILKSMVGKPPEGILEVGSNIGNNLRALRALTGTRFLAIEPNRQARETLIADGVVAAADAHDGATTSIDLPDGVADLAFTSGVLIHVHPDDLELSCREIYRVSRKYVVCIEYFADKPEMIPYRGATDKLFKRDFGSYWLDLFPDLQLLDYGFAWKRVTGLDNLTWWAFEKRS